MVQVVQPTPTAPYASKRAYTQTLGLTVYTLTVYHVLMVELNDLINRTLNGLGRELATL